jgi:hypothetical protein
VENAQFSFVADLLFLTHLMLSGVYHIFFSAVSSGSMDKHFN